MDGIGRMHVQAGCAGAVERRYYFLGNDGAFANAAYHQAALALVYQLRHLYKSVIYKWGQPLYTAGLQLYGAQGNRLQILLLHAAQR
jgi:hypothetical protein